MLLRSTCAHTLRIVQVFLIAALQVVEADSIERAALSNTKQAGSAHAPCNICKVTSDAVGDSKFDVQRHKRTGKDWLKAIAKMDNAVTNKARQDIYRKYGLNKPDTPNPLRALVHFDVVLQLPIDVFHQDALVSTQMLQCC